MLGVLLSELRDFHVQLVVIGGGKDLGHAGDVECDGANVTTVHIFCYADIQHLIRNCGRETADTRYRKG
jgi:hypothetical protein